MRKKTASIARTGFDVPNPGRQFAHRGKRYTNRSDKRLQCQHAARCDFVEESRKYFNLHLLRTNVVRDVFGRDRQLVGAGNRLFGNCQRLRCSRQTFASQRSATGYRAIHARNERARALRRADFQTMLWPRWKRLRSSFTCTTGGLLAITNVFDSR